MISITSNMTRSSFVARHIALAALLFLGSDFVMAQSQRRIPQSQLEQMFSQMRAKAPWNVDGPMLWGYFFLDGSRGKLESAASELTEKGYRVVGIEQVRVDLYRLHVERIEVHSPTSLHSRNQEFYALADRLKIASYDGMDVGPAAPTLTK